MRKLLVGSTVLGLCLVFPEPDGGALHKLAHLHIANRQFYREFGCGEKSW
jgi:hypothetical protein